MTFTADSLRRVAPSQPDLVSRLPVELAIAILHRVALPSRAQLADARVPAAAKAQATTTPGRLAARDLGAAALACRYWARLAHDEAVWRAHYRWAVAAEQFHVPPHALHPLCDFACHPHGTLSESELVDLLLARQAWDLLLPQQDAALAETLAGRVVDAAAPAHARPPPHQVHRQQQHAYYDPYHQQQHQRGYGNEYYGHPHPSSSSSNYYGGYYDPPAPTTTVAVAPHASRRYLALERIMRESFADWLAPWPPLNFRWLSKWKYASAVARQDTRRAAITRGELVKLQFNMFYMDPSRSALTASGGYLPGKLPPGYVSCYCPDGIYRTTYYGPACPIRMQWRFHSAPPDPSVVTPSPHPPPALEEIDAEEEEEDDDESEDEEEEEEEDLGSITATLSESDLVSGEGDEEEEEQEALAATAAVVVADAASAPPVRRDLNLGRDHGHPPHHAAPHAAPPACPVASKHTRNVKAKSAPLPAPAPAAPALAPASASPVVHVEDQPPPPPPPMQQAQPVVDYPQYHDYSYAYPYPHAHAHAHAQSRSAADYYCHHHPHEYQHRPHPREYDYEYGHRHHHRRQHHHRDPYAYSGAYDVASAAPALASPPPPPPEPERVSPLLAQFLAESFPRPDADQASPRAQHHARFRNSLLQVDNYLPFTVARVPLTGQWLLVNLYYLFESRHSHMYVFPACAAHLGPSHRAAARAGLPPDDNDDIELNPYAKPPASHAANAPPPPTAHVAAAAAAAAAAASGGAGGV
ncbi:hypothetical protein H9P43_003125 [Blastocladiella emersonii ATCC 22665]|nr:hypothetical protein H9P43_003125 [Blastocladiella emersonii ATCC 22665]